MFTAFDFHKVYSELQPPLGARKATAFGFLSLHSTSDLSGGVPLLLLLSEVAARRQLLLPRYRAVGRSLSHAGVLLCPSFIHL